MASPVGVLIQRAGTLIVELKADGFKDPAKRAQASSLPDECARVFLESEADRDDAIMAFATFAQLSLRCGHRERYFAAFDRILASGRTSKNFDLSVEAAFQKALEIAAEMGTVTVDELLGSAVALSASHGARPVVARAVARTLQMAARFHSGLRDVERVEAVLDLLAARRAACAEEWLPLEALALSDSTVFLLKIRRFDRAALVLKRLLDLHAAQAHVACTRAYVEALSWNLAEDVNTNHLGPEGRKTMAFELGLLADEHAKDRDVQVHLGRAAGGMIIAAFEARDSKAVAHLERTLTTAAQRFRGDAEVAFYVARAASSLASVLAGRRKRREANAMDEVQGLAAAPRRLIAAAEAAAPGNPQVADMRRKVEEALPPEFGMVAFFFLGGFVVFMLLLFFGSTIRRAVFPTAAEVATDRRHELEALVKTLPRGSARRSGAAVELAESYLKINQEGAAQGMLEDVYGAPAVTPEECQAMMPVADELVKVLKRFDRKEKIEEVEKRRAELKR